MLLIHVQAYLDKNQEGRLDELNINLSNMYF